MNEEGGAPPVSSNGFSPEISTSTTLPEDARTSSSLIQSATEQGNALPSTKEIIAEAESIFKSQTPTNTETSIADPSMLEAHSETTTQSIEPNIDPSMQEAHSQANNAESTLAPTAPPNQETTPLQVTPMQEKNDMIPSPDLTYTNNITGETGKSGSEIADEIDKAVGELGSMDTNPLLENPVAVGNSKEVEGKSPLTLAEIKSLAESKRKVAFLENRLAMALKNDEAAVQIASETISEAAEVVEEARQIKKPSEARRKIGAALGPLILFASAFLNDRGGENTNYVNPDNSPLTDSQKVELVEQMRNIGTDATESLDQIGGGIDTSSLDITGIEQTQGPINSPSNPNRPEGAVEPIPPIVGTGLSEEFKNNMADAKQE